MISATNPKLSLFYKGYFLVKLTLSKRGFQVSRELLYFPILLQMNKSPRSNNLISTEGQNFRRICDGCRAKNQNCFREQNFCDKKALLWVNLIHLSFWLQLNIHWAIHISGNQGWGGANWLEYYNTRSLVGGPFSAKDRHMGGEALTPNWILIEV